MTIGLQGQNLIFLISQPRSGSTLLQKILAGHPEIHSASEPWLMLHPLYALRKEGIEAEYDECTAWKARMDFVNLLADGEAEYVEGVRRMYAYLYDRATTISKKRCFLDKTPRYYLVIPELFRVFPRARYVILIRNPLAVISSMYCSWSHSVLFSRSHRLDLARAPHLLLEGIAALKEQCVVVHFERLVQDSESELRKICDGLKIDFDPSILNYENQNLVSWNLGDRTAGTLSRPTPETAAKWEGAIADPQAWRLAKGYLAFLGRQTVERLGYSFDALSRTLEENRPSKVRLLSTLSLASTLRDESRTHARWKRFLVKLAWTIRQRRFGGTGARRADIERKG